MKIGDYSNYSNRDSSSVSRSDSSYTKIFRSNINSSTCTSSSVGSLTMRLSLGSLKDGDRMTPFARQLSKVIDPEPKTERWMTGKTARVVGGILKLGARFRLQPGEGKVKTFGGRKIAVVRTEDKSTAGTFSRKLGRGGNGEVFDFNNTAVKRSLADGDNLKTEFDVLNAIHKDGEVPGIEKKPRKFEFKGSRELCLQKHRYNGDGYAFAQVLKGDELTKLKIFLPLFSGLQSMHDAGYSHGDIKPDNILCDKNGVVLSDLGKASPLGSGRKENGTPLFSPGYEKDKVMTDAEEKRADLHALGLSILIMLSIHCEIKAPKPPLNPDIIKEFSQSLLDTIENPKIRYALENTLYHNTEGKDTAAIIEDLQLRISHMEEEI